MYAESTLTDWHWYIAGDPNNGTDTLDDGFCFMYDGGNYGGTPFAVYNAIDITQCAFYNNPEYQNIEWYSFSDLNMIAEPDTSPIAIYQDQQAYVGIVDDETNIFGDGAEYWSGCYATGDTPTWGAIGGGECPIINNGSNQINWGYMQQSLTQISAFDTALKNAGLETYGYTYSWMVKNADANYEDTNGQDGQDTLVVTLAVRDNGGNIVYKKEFDYSYWINHWTTFSGDENFDKPFDVSTLDSVMLEVTGQDVGNWDGYFGPEFNEPNVKLKFRPIIEDNTEQLLFEQMCMNDPLYDVNCPGYQTAMMDQMNEAAGTTDLTGGTENELTAALDAGGNDAFKNDLGTIETDATGAPKMDGTPKLDGTPDPTGVEEAVAEADIGTPDPTGTPKADGTPDPTGVEETVAEAAEAVEEAVEEVAAESVAKAVEEAVEEVAAEPSAVASIAEEKKATGLNANQLNTLNAANAVANSAAGGASNVANASAGIGLSETGGVASELTSVDPTGSTTATGSIAGSTGSNFGGLQLGSTEQSINGTGSSVANTTVDFGNPGNDDGSNPLSNGTNDNAIMTATTADINNSMQAGSTIDSGNNNIGLGTNSGNGQTGEFNASSTIDIAGTGFDSVSSTGFDDPTANINTGMPDTTGFDVSAVEQSVVEQSTEQAQLAVEDLNNNTAAASVEDDLATANESALDSFEQTFAPGNPIDDLVKEMTTAILQAAVDEAEDIAEESANESFEDQNAQEDALVAEAQDGSDDEDAKAALLGYNPKIRAYQQEQAYAGGDIYSNQGMYEDQKTYDNPNARLFNGASDALHKEMVRSQYELGN